MEPVALVAESAPKVSNESNGGTLSDTTNGSTGEPPRKKIGRAPRRPSFGQSLLSTREPPKRKPGSFPPQTEMCPWTSASFTSRDSRDRFLVAVATLPPDEVEGEAMQDQSTGALVRWIPGHFLGLNDIAYAHGGRIILGGRSRRESLLDVTTRPGSRRTSFLAH